MIPMDQNDDCENLTQSYERLQKISHQMIILRNIAKTFSNQHASIDDIMTSFVHMTLEGFQSPDSMGCRVKIFDSVYETDDFSMIDNKVRKSISPYDDKDVFIEVGFLSAKIEPKLTEDDEAFLSTITLDLQSYLERERLIAVQRRQTKELELFASLMRHDLKNDIGLIMTNIDLAKMLLSDETDELHQLVTTAEAVCGRMINLLSILGTGRKNHETRIVKIIKDSTRRAIQIYPNLQITERTSDLQDIEIQFNRLLPLVFDNLFRNAAKYAGPMAKIEITGRIVDNRLHIEIQDDGPGIAESVKESLFERGVSTTGGGYGLYLSREVLKIIDGSIELNDTSPAKGACFLISLPIRKML